MSEPDFLTRAEAERLMTQAVERGARKVLQDIGIDTHEWKEQQADMRYLRQWRVGSEQIKTWGARAAITAVVTGSLWLVWQGIRAAFGLSGL